MVDAAEWDAAGDETMIEKHFKPKNAKLMICKACGEKAKIDPIDLKNHVVKLCKKQG
eukprot:CAMPEP_0196592110 /NCGR_PEP_ID=MMETSP1081-20130531/71744_1 /TAXON_ID=36882 /ORGANISM="Pyramimonas amylifera, Strain CCMP720" /LENGTH=56 /DNA_ID=CAMNT_0041915689 /DNA_START=125 /DNA_END=295 /DNA_ORIENTATION=+